MADGSAAKPESTLEVNLFLTLLQTFGERFF
jgi:hypothetical protein